MTVTVWNILDLDEEAGEEGINALVSDFTTARENEDGVLFVNEYLKGVGLNNVLAQLSWISMISLPLH